MSELGCLSHLNVTSAAFQVLEMIQALAHKKGGTPAKAALVWVAQ